MKIKFRPISVTLTGLFFVTLIAAGCSKDSYHNPNNISANIGGKVFQSSRITGTSNGSELALDGYAANQGDTSLIHIDMLTSIKVNQPDAFQNSSVWCTLNNGHTYSGEAIHAGHGTLTVTSWDSTGKRIAGTFSGIFYTTASSTDSLNITDGRFNSGYTTF